MVLNIIRGKDHCRWMLPHNNTWLLILHLCRLEELLNHHLDASPIDTSYKFGAGSEYDRPPSHYGMYMTRTNASSHALGSSSPGINSRPASSIYDLFSNHNRNGFTISKQHHKRNSSVTNNNNNNNGNSNHQASSQTSFFGILIPFVW